VKLTRIAFRAKVRESFPEATFQYASLRNGAFDRIYAINAGWTVGFWAHEGDWQVDDPHQAAARRAAA
jgi:hypothetical protein